MWDSFQRGGRNNLRDNQNSPPKNFPNTEKDIENIYKENWVAIRTYMYFKSRQMVDTFNLRVANQKQDLKKTLTALWVNGLSSHFILSSFSWCCFRP